MSQHLRVLHDVRLVSVRTEARRRVFRARAESLAPGDIVLQRHVGLVAARSQAGSGTRRAAATVTATLEQVIDIIDIDASPQTVYEMWTTAVGLCSWWVEAAEADARPGGLIQSISVGQQ